MSLPPVTKLSERKDELWTPFIGVISACPTGFHDMVLNEVIIDMKFET
jgi:hypothetical protein